MKKYFRLLNHILANGDPHEDRTGVGTISTFGYQERFDLQKGFPLLTTKKMAWKAIVHELCWFLSGRTDVQWLQAKGVKIWDAWATAEQTARFKRPVGDLGPVYGHLWRAFGQEYVGPRGWADGKKDPVTDQPTHIWYNSDGDQLKQLVHDLINNSGSRRLIVSGWDPRVATKVALPPCHTLWQCKVTEKKVHEPAVPGDVSPESWKTVKYLDLQLYQRSADSFLGVPFNIASYALLTHLLAHVTGMVPRAFVHTFGDLHIYRNHLDQVKEQMSREPFDMPQIKLNDRLKGGGWDALMDFTVEDVELIGYKHHDAIKGDVAV